LFHKFINFARPDSEIFIERLKNITHPHDTASIVMSTMQVTGKGKFNTSHLPHQRPLTDRRQNWHGDYVMDGTRHAKFQFMDFCSPNM